MRNGKSAIAARIDAFSIVVGNAVSWLTLAMVLVTFVIVVSRYLFEAGAIWLQESLTWMHGVVFMLGAAFTLQRDQHVRVDIFYRRMSAGRQAWVNALGVVIFVFPLCIFFLFESFDYVAASWSIGEVSVNAGGLPYPLVPLAKSILLLMPVAVALQGLSLLLASIVEIRKQ